jgi:hypothetical protein
MRRTWHQSATHRAREISVEPSLTSDEFAKGITRWTKVQLRQIRPSLGEHHKLAMQQHKSQRTEMPAYYLKMPFLVQQATV